MSRRPQRCGAPGFTLIELLVVLAIFGLIAGWVMPNLRGIFDGAQRRADRAQIESGLSRLGYRCFLAGHDFVLSNATLAANVDASGAAVTVPDGWTVEVTGSIRYRFDGTCTGGQVHVRQGDSTVETLELRAPHCQAVS